MGWKFPRRIPRANQTVDAEDLNSGIVPFVEEQGRLGENNWSSDLKTQLARSTDLAEDVGQRVASVSVRTTVADGPLQDTALMANEVSKHPPASAWVAIDNMSHTFTTKGGRLYVLASLQFGRNSPPRDLPSSFLGPPYLTFVQRYDVAHTLLGIQIDGAVLPLSVRGDQDYFGEGSFMELGLTGWAMGVDLCLSFPVAAGQHTVEVVANVLPGRDPVSTSRYLESLFHNRELIVVEMNSGY